MLCISTRVECRGFDVHLHHVGSDGSEVETVYSVEAMEPMLADLRSMFAVMSEAVAGCDPPEFERVESLATH